MSKKKKKILVGTACVTLRGWIFAEGANDVAFLMFIGGPLVVGLGWAFLAKDDETP